MRVLRQYALVISLAVATVGCAAQQFQRGVDNLQKECRSRTAEISGAERLEGKISLRGVDGITTAMLANHSYPSQDDKILLERVDHIAVDCSRQLVSLARRHGNPITDIIDLNYRSTQILFSRLLGGELTYAQYNRMRLELYSAFVQSAQQYLQAVRAQDIAASQAAAANLRAAAAAFAVTQPSRPALVPPPTTTNCRWIGNTLNCQSF